MEKIPQPIVDIDGRQTVERLKRTKRFLTALDCEFGLIRVTNPEEKKKLLDDANEASRLMSLGIGTPFELTEGAASAIKAKHPDDFRALLVQYKESVEVQTGTKVDSGVLEAQKRLEASAKLKLFGLEDVQIVFK